MSIIEIEKTYFFSSSVANGATNITNKGSSFEVALDGEMKVPPGALDCTIECRSANIWFIMPNISTAHKNNRLYFKYDPSAMAGFTTLWDYIEIPDGLYSLSDLNTCVRRLIGMKTMPNTTTRYNQNSITISSNSSTQRVIVQMSPGFILGVTTLENNICKTLGIDQPLNVVGILFLHVNDYHEAENTANLTPINSFLLHSDLVENGLRVNNGISNILTEIQLLSGPGTFLTYRPYLPYKLDGNHLKFSSRSHLKFYLTDQDQNPLDMFGESYSFSVVIKYKIDISAVTNVGQAMTYRRS